MAIVLDALPLATFAGILLGIAYMKAYLNFFDVSINDVAGLSDYLMAALYGMSVIAALAAGTAYGFFIVLLQTRAYDPRYYSSTATIICSATMAIAIMLGGAGWLGLLGEILHSDFLLWLNDHRIDGLAGVLFEALLCGFCGGAIFAAPLIKRQSAMWIWSLTALSTFAVLNLVMGLAGTAAARDGVRSSYIMLGPYTAVPAQFSVGDSPLPSSCRCGAQSAWIGEKGSVFVCGGKPIVVHGPENVVLESTGATRPVGSNREVILSPRHPSLPWAQETCQNAEVAERASLGRQEALREVSKWEAVATVHSADGDRWLGLACRSRVLFLASSDIKYHNSLELQSERMDPILTEMHETIARGSLIKLPNGYIAEWYAPPKKSDAGLYLVVDGIEFDISTAFSTFRDRGCL